MQRLADAWPPQQNPSPLGQINYNVQNNTVHAAAANVTTNASAVGNAHLHERQGRLRVMIVGDSMTQGQHGDFTWRYRIWQWFQSNGVAADFVGPYRGTVEAPPANPGPPAPPRLASQGPAPYTAPTFDGPYATGASFDSDHYGAWGRQVAQDQSTIYSTLTAPGNMADMILVMLGFNDMGWFVSGPEGTLESMTTFINEARRANGKMRFAVANVPQRSFIGGRDDLVVNTAKYNDLLAAQIPQWSTADSPIALVQLQENYDCAPAACPAGYDGLHPNELGEYQIARAFSLTLNSYFKMGRGPLIIPSNIPPRAMTQLVPSNFKVFSSPQGVTATWEPVLGAYSYDIESTITGSDGGVLTWNWSPQTVSSNRWDTQWPSDGWNYAVKVRARAGDTRVGPWTTVVTAVARPQLAAVPRNVVVRPTGTGVDLSWSPPTGPYSNSIVSYNVIYFDIDSCNFLTGAAFTSSPAHIDGFVPGHHIFLAIVTWNAAGQGWPEILPEVRAGTGALASPAAPGAPKINIFNPTSAQVTWDEVAGASGYAIWMRNVNNKTSVSTRLDGTVGVGCDNLYFLFPGAWNYEFCISAYNGNNESKKGACSVGAQTSVTKAEPTCPLGPQWCDGSNGVYTGPIPSVPPPAKSNPNDPGSSPPATPPSSTPPKPGGGNPNVQEGYPNADWYPFNCQNPVVTGSSLDPTYRWNAVKTADAWDAVNNAWKKSTKNVTYVTYVTNFFHGLGGMACESNNIQNACSSPQTCVGSTKAAGNLILNSFVNVAILYSDIHQSIRNAEAEVALSMDTFGDVFATYSGQAQLLLNIFLDIIGFGLGASLAPIWASVLKTSAWGVANKAGADIIKDETNGLISNGIRFSNTYKPSTSQLNINTDLKFYAGHVFDTWADMMTDFQAYIFSGTDDAIADLDVLIRYGKMLNLAGALPSDDAVAYSTRRTLWANLLPPAWSEGSAHQWAAVVDSGAACGTQNPLHKYVPDNVAAQNFACVNNRIYYLLGGSGRENSCAPPRDPVCTATPFEALHGSSALYPGNGDWDGLTVTDLIIGAVNTYTAAGNKNGAPEPAIDTNLINDLYTDNIQAPGAVRIPVCGADEIQTNWFNTQDPSLPQAHNYPCN